MADSLVPPEVRTFMEKARSEGWSDEEIVDYVKVHNAPQTPIREPTSFKGGFEKGLKEQFSPAAMLGRAKDAVVGEASQFVHSLNPFGIVGAIQAKDSADHTPLTPPSTEEARGMLDNVMHPGRALSAADTQMMTAGVAPDAPENIGRLAGATGAAEVMSRPMETLSGANAAVRGVAKAPAGVVRLANKAASGTMRALDNNPALSMAAGAGIGYYEGGIPGALIGAVAGPKGTKALRMLGKLAGDEKAAPTATAQPRARASAKAPKEVRTVDAIPVDEPIDGIIVGESGGRPALPPGRRVFEQPVGRPLSDDPSFVRSVPAQPGQAVPPQAPPQRLGLPPKPKDPIITAPPADTSGITVTSAKKTDLPVRDPKTGRMKRVFTSESAGDTPKTPVSTPEKPALQSKVQELSGKGHGAEEIADQLKDDPALKGKSKTERINLVREARGGPSGEMPGRAKQAIDQALAKLKTADEKRAYLMRAPNAAAYDYIKGRIGL
jgi:hypothetical protein